MKNGQRIAHCDACGSYTYSVPNSELGLVSKPRSSSPEKIDPSQRARILLRDRGACALCRTTDGPMETGHLVSLHEGRRYPALKDALGSDANLAVMCAQCNGDIGSQSVTLLMLAALYIEWDRRNES
jgi:hypothetical protein